MKKSIIVAALFCSVLTLQQSCSVLTSDPSASTSNEAGFFDSITDTISGGSDTKETVIGATDSEYWETYKENVLTGTVVGAAAGGVLGAVVGGKEGAMIGAAGGAVAGNLIGQSIADSVFDAVVTQDNAKEIIADNEEKISEMEESIAQLQKKTDNLTNTIDTIIAQYKNGKIDKETYNLEKSKVAERVDLLSESVTKVNDNVEGLKTQIAEAKKLAPESVPTLNEQLVAMESIKISTLENKKDLDTRFEMM